MAANLPKTYHEGYCYFTVDDGKFYIDTTDDASGRIVLNAASADTDRLNNIIDETYVTSEELDEIFDGVPALIDADTLGGKLADEFILKTDTINASTLNGKTANDFVLKSDNINAGDADSLGGIPASSYVRASVGEIVEGEIVITFADKAKEAEHAINADEATHAVSAIEAEHAVNADEATHADEADRALETDNSLMLGGKEPKYYIQPRNLLDNSDFRNPVNQRGANSYTGAGYTIDRWYAIIAENNVTVNNGDSVTINGFIRQKVTVPDGRYTIATKTTDGAVHIRQVELSGNAVTHIAGDESLYAVYEGDYYAIGINSGNYLWAALYEGEYTADNLPPYVPKGYGAELMECMRYFQRITGYDYSILANGFWWTTTSFRTHMPLTCPMIKKPTLSMDYSRFQVCSSGGIQLTPSDVWIAHHSGNGVSLTITTPSNTQGLAGLFRSCIANENSYMDFSADL